MAQFDLYIDTVNGGLVTGPANPAPASLPRFYQGDTISLRIYLLARTPTYPQVSPYSVINNANLSLKVALGPKTGTPGSTLLTQQFTWAKDAANQYFYADLPLNTAAINSAIGAAESVPAWFEVEYTQNSYPTTVLQQNVTIHAEVIETGSIVTPPGETPLSSEIANATFLKPENFGFTIVNPNTGQKMAIYLGNDGQLKAELIS